MIRFACPECRRTIEVAEDRGGGTVGCPNCGRPVSVPTLLPVDAASRPAVVASARAREVRWPRPRTNPLRTAAGLAARALSLWRFGSPASLLLALVIFFLPWVEVRCDRPFGERGSKTLAVQSGLQAAYGGYTEAPLTNTDRSERDRLEAEVRTLRGEPAVSWSPLMAVYPLVLLGGCLIGVRVRRDWARRTALVGCSLAAGLLLLLQASRGFSLERAVRTLDAKGQLAGADFRIALSTSGLLEFGYTRWFWLSAVALGCALAAACAEWWLNRAPRASFFGQG
jgi:hypothetical protein